MQEILQNPFRTLGLPANASERALVARMDELRTLAAIGREPEYDLDLLLPRRPDRSQPSVADACLRLRNPDLRLAAALTWLWSVPGQPQLDRDALLALSRSDPVKARELWAAARAKLSPEAPAWTACTCNMLLTHWLALVDSADAVLLYTAAAGVVNEVDRLGACSDARAALAKVSAHRAGEQLAGEVVAKPAAHALETVFRQAGMVFAVSKDRADDAMATCLSAMKGSTHFSRLARLVPSAVIVTAVTQAAGPQADERDNWKSIGVVWRSTGQALRWAATATAGLWRSLDEDLRPALPRLLLLCVPCAILLCNVISKAVGPMALAGQLAQDGAGRRLPEAPAVAATAPVQAAAPCSVVRSAPPLRLRDPAPAAVADEPIDIEPDSDEDEEQDEDFDGDSDNDDVYDAEFELSDDLDMDDLLAEDGGER